MLINIKNGHVNKSAHKVKECGKKYNKIQHNC